MKRQTKMAARTIVAAMATILLFGMVAVAQDYDRDDYRGNVAQTQQYGYQNGYRDGMDRGRHEGRENDPFDYRTPDWRQATRGYQPWMGPVSVFQQGYQQGYASGFRAGFVSMRPGWRDGDRDDYRPESYSGDRYNGNVGYNFGYQDGAQTARDDLYHNKPFNPNPRGRFDDMDHGYRREYGDKGYYKSQYATGYRSGYESVFNRRY
jgi:hypothetical protein